MTPAESDFVDYYEVLQISPRAEMETVRRVFKLLATRVHPDNPVTGDAEQFRVLKQAYETLSDPDRREHYDLVYEQRAQEPLQRRRGEPSRSHPQDQPQRGDGIRGG